MHVRLPDGSLIEVPDGSTRADVDRIARERGMQIGPPPPENPHSLTNLAGAAIEPNLALGSGAVATPIAGLAGIAGAALPGPAGQGADWAQSVQRALQYEPRTTGGKNAMSVIGAPFEALGAAADTAGEKVSNVLGPGAGAAVNTALQAAPMALGARSMRLPPASETLPGVAGNRVMQAALRPSVENINAGKAAQAAQTALKSGSRDSPFPQQLNPTLGGMERADALTSPRDALVKALVQQSPAEVSVPRIASEADAIALRKLKQNVPGKDLAEISDVLDEFYNHPLFSSTGRIPVALAHELKQGTYQAIGKKPYVEQSTAGVEVQKALARGERKAVADAVPATRKPLAEEAELRNLMDVAGSRAAAESKTGVPLPYYLANHPLAGVGYAGATSAYVQAQLARALYQMGDPAARRALIASGGISQEQQ